MQSKTGARRKKSVIDKAMSFVKDGVRKTKKAGAKVVGRAGELRKTRRASTKRRAQPQAAKPKGGAARSGVAKLRSGARTAARRLTGSASRTGRRVRKVKTAARRGR